VREATGRNDGKQVEKYLASVRLGKGYAWCGAFVNWCLLQRNIAGSQYGAMANAWFPNAKVIWKQNAKSQNGDFTPGKADLFGIYYSHLKRIGHVGFIDEWQAGKGVVITVEGNTNDAGSREGDGVYRKRRLIRQIYRVSRWVNGGQSKFLPASSKTISIEPRTANYWV
jgi:hypothetical protein